MALFAIIPWVLTLGTLAYIIIRNMKNNDDELEDEFGKYDEQTIRVAVYQDKAYWVKDNVFYESEVLREPDFETAKPIDTMSLSPKDLNRLLSILDDLEESEKE